MMDTERRSPSKNRRDRSLFVEAACRVRKSISNIGEYRRRRAVVNSKQSPHENEKVTISKTKNQSQPKSKFRSVFQTGSSIEDIESAFADVSEVDLHKYESVWTFVSPMESKEIKMARREQIRTFIEATLKKGPRGLIVEFRQIPKYEDLAYMTEFVAQLANKKNRYRDVGCLDENRVILTLGPCSYIHANYVSTPNNARKFICTQGPLPHTCSEFWCMVVQEKSKIIVMLCNLIEKEASKCAAYYPTQTGETLTFDGDISVHCKNRDRLRFPFETNAKVEVTTLKVVVPGQEPHLCTHYHWVDWPDRGVPRADLAPLYLLHQFFDSKQPVIVHCSAGIGRTGSMVLLQHAMEVLEKGDVLHSMNVYLEQLRTQRSNSVQNEQQYLYVHQVLLNFFRITGWLPESLDPVLETFKKTYSKYTN